MKSKVSIIIPIFNQENNLHISFPAVINQEWKNIEIVAVNDGSTDKSEQIIDEYICRDDRIVKINKSNGGLIDATITGIKNSTGDYICFLDPDDIIGPNFVSNFMEHIQEYDVIAMGHFENDGILIKEHRLTESKKYKSKNDINILKNNFLYENGQSGISQRIFISRWNKLYKSSIVKKIVPEFEKVKNVSLGEDTIFTYLILQKISSLITVAEPNSYIYNTMSSTSMMKNGAIDLHLEKANIAYKSFLEIIKNYNGNVELANVLYYFLCNSLIDRMRKNTNYELKRAYQNLHNDEKYNKGKSIVKPITMREKIKRICWYMPSQISYYRISNFINSNLLFGVKNAIEISKEPKRIMNDLTKYGFADSIQLLRFRRKRRNAFRDLNSQLSVIEERIEPIIKKWRGIKSDFNQCTIEKNVFVFWWDGFEKAPSLVKECLKSVIKKHNDFQIIRIDKNNYKKYTDINESLIAGFESGKISIQTFSDILRFNLLKNNGGIWIDSTIFFANEFDLLDGLKTNSINSLAFNSSANFLKYKNCVCSWSGYYFASRKNSVFTNVMDDIFEKYYLQYKAFPIYFFIDAALMICKVNKIDDDALSKTKQSWGDMAFLANVADKEFSLAGGYISTVVPQKLSWSMDMQKYGSQSYIKKVRENI